MALIFEVTSKDKINVAETIFIVKENKIHQN